MFHRADVTFTIAQHLCLCFTCVRWRTKIAPACPRQFFRSWTRWTVNETEPASPMDTARPSRVNLLPIGFAYNNYRSPVSILFLSLFFSLSISSKQRSFFSIIASSLALFLSRETCISNVIKARTIGFRGRICVAFLRAPFPRESFRRPVYQQSKYHSNKFAHERRTD